MVYESSSPTEAVIYNSVQHNQTPPRCSVYVADYYLGRLAAAKTAAG